ncbi:hypothetical protein F0U60_13005 [Archangium minus]|uniref:Uncharacterized protein n=1 Tax=Archangium minus TaxID=83450 RepID=A0ABY9WR34_9BACT|nr:hypothetical protein F0U60_13005 [Archangium minus]
MSASFTFDDSLWPLLISRLTGVLADKQYSEYLARLTAYVERGERYVCISDLRRAGLFTAAQRQMQVAWIRQHEVSLRERVLGNATLITSAPIRLSLSLIYHLKPLPMPNVVVADMNAAVRYILGKLEEGGLVSEAERIRLHFGLPGTHVG